MPPGRSFARSRPLIYASVFLLAAATMLLLAHFDPADVNAQGEAKQLFVFSPQSTYTTPLLEVGGQPYVGIVELLEPLGSIEAKPNGKKLKLKFTPPGARQQELELQDGKDAAKLGGNKLKLPANFVMQNGRGYVPLAAVSELLPRFGMQPIELRGNQRLFIGNSAERFTTELKKGTPSRLIFAFPAAVNPTVATEPGKVRLTFKREPIVALWGAVRYEDPLITGARYSEHDGIVELEVNGTSPLMANFADGNKTIIVSAAPGPPTQAVQQLPVQVPQAATSLPGPVAQPPSRPRFLVLIDPAHGGNDIGAAISPQLPEKDVVLALARRVQHELGARGIAASLLRNGDYAIPLEQRAISINAARPALYIALHAANTGKGVHVFTAMLGAENSAPGGFLTWDTAQAAFTDLSGSVAGSISAELESRKVTNATLPAPLRPVNNVAAPAVGIEIAPPGTDVAEIASAGYQTQVAQSIAAGVAAMRSKLPEVRP